MLHYLNSHKKRFLQRLVMVVGLLGIGFTLWLPANDVALAERSPDYIFPRPDAQFASPFTTIAIRDGRLIERGSLDESQFEVVGDVSGAHSGEVVLARDGKTIVFKPDQPFVPGETVDVSMLGGIRTRSGARLNGLDFSFRTSAQSSEVTPERLDAFYGELAPPGAEYAQPIAATAPMSGYITLPDDFPNLMVTANSGDTAEGHVFLANHHKNWLEAKPYLLIIDDAGEPIWYRKMTEGRPVNDFKKQPTGVLTYWDAETGRHHALDDSYEIVETFKPEHGYNGDFHDFQLLPNGNKLFLIWVTQEIDMSVVVDGGRPDARVTSAIIQEVDPDGNVLFEWHGLDHIPITDTIRDVRAGHIDYMHTNTVEVDFDGNILISSRHLHEVTKINRQTGEIIWRMGGGNGNEFTFIDDPDNGFALQHDIRRLPNGHITLFDNRSGNYSRAVEYAVNPEAKTATLVWAYDNESGRHSFIMGSTQRLPGGNTMIGWSSIWRADTGWTGTYPLLTEVTETGEKAWELTVDVPIFTYRGFRFPWEGQPNTEPTLVVDIEPPDTVLTYSWNGATGVSAYRVYGDENDFPLTLLEVEPKIGFETSTVVEGIADPGYHYRVVPLDESGQPMIPDPTTVTPTPTPTATLTPTITPTPTEIPRRYKTAPLDLPPFTVNLATNETDEGYIFIAPYERHKGTTPYSPYLLIIDNDGELVYHKKMPASAEDFKKQPGNQLSYTIGGSARHNIMDASYAITEVVTAANGFRADFHDFQITPDGHMFLLIFERRTVDMSVIVDGGAPDATVIGCRIQELDEGRNVVFEWSSFDHFAITDTTKSLLEQNIDYVHCNSIERDSDDNLLLSSRDMDEITKIDGQTGEIIWRLGGKNNEFAFVNTIGAEDVDFVKQHDARWAAPGRITLFDNRMGAGNYSRAMEYELDETNKVASLVWEYRNTPDIHAHIMANTQRLPNGNTLLGWGSGHPSVTESKPDGTKVFELALSSDMQSYRAFRFPWEGLPDIQPTLVVDIESPDTALTYSWNGATGVSAYRVYGDETDFPLTLLKVEPKTGFETSTLVEGIADPAYHYRVVPVDADGNPMIPDPITPTPSPTLPPTPTRRPTKTATPTVTPSLTPIPVYDIYLPMFVSA